MQESSFYFRVFDYCAFVPVAVWLRVIDGLLRILAHFLYGLKMMSNPNLIPFGALNVNIYGLFWGDGAVFD